MNQETLEEQEYIALQAEKRDKLNGRLQVWSLFFGLVGAAGFAFSQNNALVALYPPLAACLARYSGHSERVLDQVKARLHAIEVAHGFSGYEEENKAKAKTRGSGSHVKALRDALVITEFAASSVTVWFLRDLLVFAVPVALVEIIAIIVTILSLRSTHGEHRTIRHP